MATDGVEKSKQGRKMPAAFVQCIIHYYKRQSGFQGVFGVVSAGGKKQARLR